MNIYLVIATLYPNTLVEKSLTLSHLERSDKVVLVNTRKSDEAYYEFLREVWQRKQTLVIIEQDIVVRYETVDTLKQCKGDWCAYNYRYLDGFHAGLGCVKFSAAIQARHPEIFDKIAQRSTPQHPPKHWCTLDQLLSIELRAAGEKQCIHNPPLQHIRKNGEYTPSHGCHA